jgi:hypothetical protein
LVTSFAIVSYFLLFLSISLYLKAQLRDRLKTVWLLHNQTGCEDTKLLQINKEKDYEKELIAHDCRRNPHDRMWNSGATCRDFRHTDV